jgi:hypothetical protein
MEKLVNPGFARHVAPRSVESEMASEAAVEAYRALA